MRWGPLSLAMGAVLLLLAACARPQSAPSPEISAATETEGQPEVGNSSQSSPQPVRVERRYAFRIDFSDANYNSGKPGTGMLLLSQRDDAETYTAYWNFDRDPDWDGLALPSGGNLSMGIHWFPAEYPRFQNTLGLAIYHIEDGKLIGTVVEELRSQRHRFTETLLGPSSLNGRFEIEAAGPSRQGYVKITPKKGGYLIARTGDHPVMSGVGLRVGDMLIVSYGSRMSSTVAYFCRTDAGLRGLLLDFLLEVHSVMLTNPDQQTTDEADHKCLGFLEAVKP